MAGTVARGADWVGGAEEQENGPENGRQNYFKWKKIDFLCSTDFK